MDTGHPRVLEKRKDRHGNARSEGREGSPGNTHTYARAHAHPQEAGSRCCGRKGTETRTRTRTRTRPFGRRVVGESGSGACPVGCAPPTLWWAAGQATCRLLPVLVRRAGLDAGRRVVRGWASVRDLCLVSARFACCAGEQGRLRMCGVCSHTHWCLLRAPLALLWRLRCGMCRVALCRSSASFALFLLALEFRWRWRGMRVGFVPCLELSSPSS